MACCGLVLGLGRGWCGVGLGWDGMACCGGVRVGVRVCAIGPPASLHEAPAIAAMEPFPTSSTVTDVPAHWSLSPRFASALFFTRVSILQPQIASASMASGSAVKCSPLLTKCSPLLNVGLGARICLRVEASISARVCWETTRRIRLRLVSLLNT